MDLARASRATHIMTHDSSSFPTTAFVERVSNSLISACAPCASCAEPRAREHKDNELDEFNAKHPKVANAPNGKAWSDTYEEFRSHDAHETIVVSQIDEVNARLMRELREGERERERRDG